MVINQHVFVFSQQKIREYDDFNGLVSNKAGLDLDKKKKKHIKNNRDETDEGATIEDLTSKNDKVSFCLSRTFKSCGEAVRAT